MKELLRILTILIAVSVSQQTCVEGCLSCGLNNKCILCDFSQSYFLQGDGCVKSDLKNCLTIDLNGNCLVCKTGFYKEKDKKDCTAVPEESILPECLFYALSDAGIVCTVCNTGFYPSEKCIALTAEEQITNCQIYSKDKKCAECSESHSLRIDSVTCVANPTNNSCSAFTTVGCQECKTGFVRENDYVRVSARELLIPFYNVDAAAEDLVQAKSLLQSRVKPFLNSQIQSQNNCLAEAVTNCAQFSTYNICSECDVGYFLRDNKCIEIPKETIPNCFKYSSEKVCQECLNFFFLSNNTCQAVTAIEGCLRYDGSASETVCLQCFKSRFLNKTVSPNRCDTRTVLPNLCLEYNLTADNCVSCQTVDNIRYVITNDLKKCLPEFLNCKTYSDSTVDSLAHSCFECNDGYYYDDIDKICRVGDNANCKRFSRTSNNCEQCNNGYFIITTDNQTNVCEKHDPIPDCLTYSQTQKNVCNTCNTESFLMTKNTTCIQVDIEGCEQYSSATACQSCKNGYDKVSEKECLPILPETNCLRAEEGECTLCEDDYFLLDKECFRGYDYEMENCFKTNYNGTSDTKHTGECQICFEKSIPINQKDNYVCVSDVEYERIQPDYYVPNCTAYQLVNDSTFSCVQCEHLFVLTDGGDCVEECNDFLLDLNFSVTGSNIKYSDKTLCVTSAIDAEEITLDQDFAHTANVLNDDEKWLIDPNDTDYRLVRPSDLPGDAHPAANELYKLNKINNTIENDVDIFDSEGFVDHCDNYTSLLNDYHGCNKCIFGYFGQIIHQRIKYCNEYDGLNCIKCIQGYYPIPLEGGDASEKRICTEQDIPFCEFFYLNKYGCRQCEKGYYVNGDDECSPNESDFCEHKDLFDDKCIRCLEGYILDDSDLCQKKLDNCLQHDFDGDTIICTECDITYYITAEQHCKKGSIPNCYNYNQDKDDTYCLHYYNSFDLTFTNKCRLPELILNCSEYLDLSTCEICAADHYLISGHCCKFGHYPTDHGKDVECEGEIEDSDCKTFDTNDDCVSCYQGYYKVDGENQCCQYGHFWDGNDCKENLYFDDGNTPKCLVYDFVNQKCDSCIDGHHLSHDHCCPDDWYYSTDACVENTIDGCEVQDDAENCDVCEDGLHSPKCCASDEYLDTDTTECTTIPLVDCKEYNQTDDKCEECVADDLYLFDKGCCEKTGKHIVQDGDDWVCQDFAGATVIDDCGIYDSDGICVECIADFAKDVYGDDLVYCCAHGTTFDGFECRDIEEFYDNCSYSASDYVRKDNGPNGALTFPENLCAKCQEGHYIHRTRCVEFEKYWNHEGETLADISNLADFVNCHGVSDDNTLCTHCPEGHYQQSDKVCCQEGELEVGGECVDLQEVVDTCSFYDNANHICVETLPGDVSYDSCIWEPTQKYYQNGTVCVPEGWKLDGADVVDITVPHCVRQGAGNCMKCAEGYYLDGTDCLEITDCYLVSGNECSICEEGFANTQTDTHCSDGGNNDACNETDAATCVDGKPGIHFYGANPCEYGFKWDTDKCVPITNPYCAIVADNGNCTECFTFLDNTCESESTIFLQDNINYLTSTQSVHDDAFTTEKGVHLLKKYRFDAQIYLSSTTNQCCPHTQYWNGSQCVAIPIDNCMRGNNTSCSLCLDGFQLTNGKCCPYKHVFANGECVWNATRTCNSITGIFLGVEGIEKYESNNHCCFEGTYFDEEAGRCLIHPDENCLQSEDRHSCTKCATDFFIQEDYPIQYIMKSVNWAKQDCSTNDRNIAYTACAPNSLKNVTGLEIYYDAQKIVHKCANLASDSECDECFEGYHKSDGLCCRLNQVNLNNRCIDLNKLFKNSLDFNFFTKEVHSCKEGYHLSIGICCPTGSHNDHRYNECLIHQKYCEEYNPYTQSCISCQDGTYKIDDSDKCCPFGTYYDHDDEECLVFKKPGMFTCTKGTDDNVCEECISHFEDDDEIDSAEREEYSYLTNSRCCALGYYFDDEGDRCSEIENPNCLYLDNGKCQVCELGYQLFKERDTCCPTGTYPEDDGVCVSSQKDENCEHFEKVEDDYLCTQCGGEDTYVSNGNCCETGSFYSTVYKQCIPIVLFDANNFYTNCLQVNSDGKCIKCRANHYLAYVKTGTDFENLSALARQCVKNDHVPEENSQTSIHVQEFATEAKMDAECSAADIIAEDFACKKCKNSKIAVYEDPNITCETIVNDNCNMIVYDGATYTDCLSCKTGYYRTLISDDDLQPTCCIEGEYWDGDSCEVIDASLEAGKFTNCLKVEDDTGNVCTKCENSYYLVLTDNPTKYCVQFLIAPVDNCLVEDGGGDCILCEESYHVKDGACSQDDIIKYKTPLQCRGNDSAVDHSCIGCADGYYLTNEACCQEGEIFDTDSNMCIAMNANTNTTGCVKHSDSKCEACNKDDSLHLIQENQGVCCPINYVWNNGCQKKVQNGLTKCNFYENVNNCREKTDDDPNEPVCLDDYYFVTEKCCPEGQTYADGLCSAIESKANTCLQVDGNNNCTLCQPLMGEGNNVYITDGACCAQGTYFDGENCETIPAHFVNCLEFDNNKCTLCNPGVLSDDGICCQGYYFSHSTDECVELDDDCDDFNTVEEKCESCVGGKYLSHGTCVDFTKYMDGDTETDIGITDCDQVQDQLVDGDLYCVSCSNDKIASNGACCDSGSTYDHADDVCLPNGQLENCLEWGSEGELCEKCKENYYLSDSICCAHGTIANGDLECVEIEHDNCAEQVDVNCTVCIQGHFLHNNKCCEIGDDSDPECEMDVEHCIEDDGDCQKCEEGYYLNHDSTHCCEYGHYYNESFGLCVHFDRQLENCIDYELNDSECQKCADDHYLNAQDESFCDPYGQQSVVEDENLEEKKIIYEYCDIIDEIGCTQCQDGFHRYSNKCCRDDEYLNIHDQCEKIPDFYCLEYHKEDKCTKCEENYSNFFGHCCQEGYYYDEDEEDCLRDLIDHCNTYEQIENDVYCKECDAGFVLTDDQNHCCLDYDFYDVSTRECLTEPKLNRIHEHCINYNHDEFECLDCQEEYYLSRGVCVEYGQVVNGADQVVAIGITDCITAEDDEGIKCLECDDDFHLDTNTCVANPLSCKVYDLESTSCSECDQDTYNIFESICCPAGQVYDDGDSLCEAGSKTNCLYYDKESVTDCLVCEDNYYLLNGYCVQEGFYLHDTNQQTEGDVDHCLQYPVDDSEVCERCKLGYALADKKDGETTETFCMLIQHHHCRHHKMILDNGLVNEVVCDQCVNNHFAEGLEEVDHILINYQIDLDENHCLHYDIKEKVVESEFSCRVCEDGYYLDVDKVCQSHNTVDNCAEYSQTSDACIRCTRNYDLVGNTCVLHTSITNCVYKNQNACLYCNETSYTIEDGTISCDSITDFDHEHVEEDAPEEYPGYIKKCEFHHQCTNEFFAGASLLYQNYLSCHKCQDDQRMPVLFMERGESALTLSRYSYFNPQANLDQFNDSEGHHNGECFLKDFSEIHTEAPVRRLIDVNNNPSNFPSNCAYAILITNQQFDYTEANDVDATDWSHLSLVCGDCLPGYKPVYGNTLTTLIFGCDAIDNCALAEGSFNKCDQCNEGFSFNYNNGIDRTACISSNSRFQDNCYAFDQNANECKACLDGYQKNYDGVCEQLGTDYCDHNGNLLKQYSKSDFELSFYRGDKGCLQCTAGYTRLLRQEDDFACVNSTYVEAEDFITGTNYIDGCVRYGPSGASFKCFVCKDTHLLTNTGDCLTRQTQHDRCTLLADNGNCVQCSDAGTLVQGACLVKNITNCKTYSEGQTAITCSLCNDKFYLKDNTCHQGGINHCRVYTNETVCSVCDSGFQQVRLSGDISYCSPVTTINNCGALNGSSFQNMTVQCSTCDSDYYLSNLGNSTQTVCNRIQLIRNCVDYHKNTNFSDSTLKCKKCQKDHFLENNECKVRQLIVDRCLVYSDITDLCSECENDFYLNETKTLCLPNPIGIVGCSLFSEEDVCILCRSGFYLIDNVCKVVPENKQDVNCKARDSAADCIECNNGFFLQADKTCIGIEVTNCQELANFDSCSVCIEGYGISVVNEKNTCIQLDAIGQCLKRNQTSPYNCDKCNPGYFLEKENTCTFSEAVVGCFEYTDANTCALCLEDYVLSLDKKKCIKNAVDTNCSSRFQVEQPVCVVCKSGFRVDSQGNCTEITNKIDRCLLSRLEDSKICSVCELGNYMNEKFECVSTAIVNPNPTPTDGSSLKSIFWLLAFLSLNL